MTALSDTYEKEQREFFMNTSSWVDIHPSQLLGQPYTLKEFDMHTVRPHTCTRCRV
jgi:protein arginine N-methyltransferase 1